MWRFKYNVDIVNLQKWRDCSINYVENANSFYNGPKEMLWENSQDMVLTDKLCEINMHACMYMCACVEMKNKRVNKFQRENNVEKLIHS